MSDITLKIDGKLIPAKAGMSIKEAADAKGIYIPVLCHKQGLKPAGVCRMCTVRVAGRLEAACTTPAQDQMMVENETDEIRNIRRSLIEMLFVEGNHYCPFCEKSGKMWYKMYTTCI